MKTRKNVLNVQNDGQLCNLLIQSRKEQTGSLLLAFFYELTFLIAMFALCQRRKENMQ